MRALCRSENSSQLIVLFDYRNGLRTTTQGTGTRLVSPASSITRISTVCDGSMPSE